MHDCVAEVYAPSPTAADLRSLRGVEVQCVPAVGEMRQDRRAQLAEWLPLVDIYASAVLPRMMRLALRLRAAGRGRADWRQAHAQRWPHAAGENCGTPWRIDACHRSGRGMRRRGR